MKLKLTFIAAAMTMAVAVQAGGLPVFTPHLTTNNSRLNVSLTVLTNGPTIEKGHAGRVPIDRAKITDKDLLALFAHWNDTTWPDGARLVVGWDADRNVQNGHSGDILVVDKSGTNVLYDATTNWYAESDHYFFVNFYNDFGAPGGHFVDATPGMDSVVQFNSVYYQLYDDFFLPLTDLSEDGGSIQHFFQNWDANGGKDWSDSEDATFPFEGDQFFNGHGWETSVGGKINADGHGHGYNWLGATGA